MSRPESPSDIEAYVRRLFAPDAAAVERVLARVFQTGSHQRRWRRRWGWAAVVSTTLMLATIAGWRWKPPARPSGTGSFLSVTGDRDLVIVERAVDGRRWAVVPAQDGDRVGNYVIVRGR